MNNTKKRFFLYIIFFVIIFIIIFIFKNGEKQNNINFAILPHFMIEPKTFDDFYSNLKDNYGDVENVVLISPNHFSLGGKGINTWCNTGNLCFNEDCISPGNINNIYFGKLNFDCGISNMSKAGFMDLFVPTIGNNFKTREHGIGGHFKYINQYFPKTKLYIFMLSPNNKSQSQQMQKLIQELQKKHKKKTFLVLGSIDFSHHIPEKFALLHDIKTWSDLSFYDKNSSDKIDYYDLDLDCPACLQVIHESAVSQNLKPSLRFRDSSEVYYGSDDNTSRFFINYGNNKKEGNYTISEVMSGFTFAFLGDTIYDRGVVKKYSGYKRLKQRLIDFYPKTAKQHKLLGGLDFAILNLETPLVFDKKNCLPKIRETQFCSDEILAEVLSEMGINAVNIANNHIFDNGYTGVLETMKVLDKYGIKYFGNFKKYNFTGFESFVWNGEIRGEKFVWLGYDVTTDQDKVDDYILEISSYKKSGHAPFVSIHRGIEYETGYNNFQQRVAEKFIDAGAEVIIGHHPHVIQDISYYNSKPIIYSIGNFLLDQIFIPNTMTGLYVLGNVGANGNQIWTGKIDSF